MSPIEFAEKLLQQQEAGFGATFACSGILTVFPESSGFSSRMSLTTPLWEDGRWSGLPSLDSDIDTDVCVIGLGGSGLTCVAELLAMSRSVVGIDGEQVAAGAAGRNGGILRPGLAANYHESVRSIGRARATRIYQLTIDEIERVRQQLPARTKATGLLRLAATDVEYADCLAQRDAMLADGLRAEEYAGVLGRGLFLPDAAAFQPLNRCRALAGHVARSGARLFERTPALAFSAHEVTTPRGRIRCAATVIAVDGRLAMLIPEVRGTVRTARLQMLATGPVPGSRIPCPVSLDFGFDYAQQLPDGTLAVGGGRNREMEAEWTDDANTTESIQRHLEQVAERLLTVRAPITHRWAASVSYTTTGLPVLAEVRAGVWAIGGYSGNGNLVGALCGRAAAHLACGEPSEFASLLAESTGPP